MTSPIFQSLELIIIAIGGFFVAREIIVWYFKIGEISNSLKNISKSLEETSESLKNISSNQGFDFDSKINLLKISQSLNEISGSIKSIPKNSS